MSLLKGRDTYKPFDYPIFFDLWKTHENGHWSPSEVAMANDIKDWKTVLTESQKLFVTNVFRFFTQGDVDIASAYAKCYIPYFNCPEVRMMLTSFAAREAVHIHAYSHLIDTLNMPDATYKEFLSYESMKNKQQYIMKYIDCHDEISKNYDEMSDLNIEHIATSIALFSGFTEGMQLFSSFAMLLLFQHNGLLLGMGRIVAWSVIDENNHTNGMIHLYKLFVEENIDRINISRLKNNINNIAIEMVKLEDAFIDETFGTYESFFDLTAKTMKNFIRFIADKRLEALQCEKIYNIKDNPLPWIEQIINAQEHANFFEQTSTSYSKIDTTNTWNDVWS